MAKPKVAFYWCASCGGCEEAVVDLAEDILKVVEAVDIVFWPVAMDFKRSDVEAMADGEIAVSFINGGIRLTEQKEMAELLRRKSQLVIAFGSCSHLGGIPGLANLYRTEELLQEAYENVPTVDNPHGVRPQMELRLNGHELELPQLLPRLYPLDQVVEVDYYLPGCPPTPKLLMQAVEAILKGELPEKGTVLAPDKALCEACDRNETKPEKLLIKDLKRVHETNWDPEKCFLAQGIVCLGPATRNGCEALCIDGNMPCTGCFGPTSRVRDYGGKALSGIASLIDLNDEREVALFMERFLPDPAGVFYKYSLPSAMIPGRVAHDGESATTQPSTSQTGE